MKTTFKSVATTLFCALALMTTSCDSSDSSTTPNASRPGKFKDLNASSYSTWTYFSFSKGDTVKVSDPKTDKSWDIAFHRQHIRVNAAESFSGMGGIYKTSKTDFGAVVLGDVKGAYLGNVMAKRTNRFDFSKMMSGASIEELYEYIDDYYVNNASANKNKNDYTTYVVDYAAHNNGNGRGAHNMYPIVGNVYIVKAADGKSIYKFQIASSTDAKDQHGGFLSFSYSKVQ